MTLSEYLAQEPGRAAKLAAAIGVPSEIVPIWSGNPQSIPANHMAAIERATGHVVTCQGMFPDARYSIWPELASAKPAQDRATQLASQRETTDAAVRAAGLGAAPAPAIDLAAAIAQTRSILAGLLTAGQPPQNSAQTRVDTGVEAGLLPPAPAIGSLAVEVTGLAETLVMVEKVKTTAIEVRAALDALGVAPAPAVEMVAGQLVTDETPGLILAELRKMNEVFSDLLFCSTNTGILTRRPV